MKLQLALDCLTTEKALEILEGTQQYVDIIEVGTPLLKHEGVSVIKKIREIYPGSTIVADMKTMDCGKYEADFAFEAGADIVTVLACADDKTVLGTLESAENHGKKAQVDMINLGNQKMAYARWASGVGFHYIGIHTGIDMQLQGESPLNDLINISGVIPLEKISVAGGINLTTLPHIMEYKPGIIVVGGAITNAANPAKVAEKMREMINDFLHPVVEIERDIWQKIKDFYISLVDCFLYFAEFCLSGIVSVFKKIKIK